MPGSFTSLVLRLTSFATSPLEERKVEDRKQHGTGLAWDVQVHHGTPIDPSVRFPCTCKWCCETFPICVSGRFNKQRSSNNKNSTVRFYLHTAKTALKHYGILASTHRNYAFITKVEKRHHENVYVNAATISAEGKLYLKHDRHHIIKQLANCTY